MQNVAKTSHNFCRMIVCKMSQFESGISLLLFVLPEIFQGQSYNIVVLDVFVIYFKIDIMIRLKMVHLYKP